MFSALLPLNNNEAKLIPSNDWWVEKVLYFDNSMIVGNISTPEITNELDFREVLMLPYEAYTDKLDTNFLDEPN